jgi:hypothetical protein
VTSGRRKWSGDAVCRGVGRAWHMRTGVWEHTANMLIVEALMCRVGRKAPPFCALFVWANELDVREDIDRMRVAKGLLRIW